MFLLLLIGLGAAGVKAQVRIGGNTPPNPAAALDLNAAEGTTTGTKGLALPRVTLGSNTATLDGTTANITGMLVYNTSGTLSTGVYYWNGSIWNKVDDAIGNELTDTIAGGGLTKTGTGTTANPYKVGIKTTPADSGFFLFSDGKTVTFTRAIPPTAFADTIRTLSVTPAVTWLKVVDTTWISDNVPPFTDQRILVTGLLPNDLCYGSASQGDVYYHVWSNTILAIEV